MAPVRSITTYTAYLRETSEGGFADTFYWVALTNPDDASYRDAKALDGILSGAGGDNR